MTQFKINKNKPLPSEDLINKHKDFEKLISKHQKITDYKTATKPLYKNPRFMGFVIVLGIVLLTIIITQKESEEKNTTKSDTVKKDSIEAEIKDTLKQ